MSCALCKIGHYTKRLSVMYKKPRFGQYVKSDFLCVLQNACVKTYQYVLLNNVYNKILYPTDH